MSNQSEKELIMLDSGGYSLVDGDIVRVEGHRLWADSSEFMYIPLKYVSFHQVVNKEGHGQLYPEVCLGKYTQLFKVDTAPNGVQLGEEVTPDLVKLSELENTKEYKQWKQEKETLNRKARRALMDNIVAVRKIFD